MYIYYTMRAMGPRGGPTVAAGRTTGCAGLSRSMDAKGKLDDVATVAGTDPTSGMRGPEMGLPAEAILAVRSAVFMFQASGFELGAFLAEAGTAWLKSSLEKDAAMGVENVEDGKERACRNCTRQFFPCKVAAAAAREHGTRVQNCFECSKKIKEARRMASSVTGSSPAPPSLGSSGAPTAGGTRPSTSSTRGGGGDIVEPIDPPTVSGEALPTIARVSTARAEQRGSTTEANSSRAPGDSEVVSGKRPP